MYLLKWAFDTQWRYFFFLFFSPNPSQLSTLIKFSCSLLEINGACISYPLKTIFPFTDGLLLRMRIVNFGFFRSKQIQSSKMNSHQGKRGKFRNIQWADMTVKRKYWNTCKTLPLTEFIIRTWNWNTISNKPNGYVIPWL